ncbi:MAG: glycosyltransferase family 2 protein [Marivivens sp.]
MKNEGPYILEWVAHHLAIGFGHFIVVTNDCEDGTDEILLALQQRGPVTHVINQGCCPRILGSGRSQH